MYLLSKVNKLNREDYKAFRLQVKQRLYLFNLASGWWYWCDSVYMSANTRMMLSTGRIAGYGANREEGKVTSDIRGSGRRLSSFIGNGLRVVKKAILYF